MDKNIKLIHRKATLEDLSEIINLLLEDELGSAREVINGLLDERYVKAFHKINNDQNQYLMVVEREGKIIGTCHLTLMSSLTFIGSTRLQIEAVRVMQKYRGQKIGEWMAQEAIKYGKSKGASIIQLTTNKRRTKAKYFYEKIGFEATHEGMKLYLQKI